MDRDKKVNEIYNRKVIVEIKKTSNSIINDKKAVIQYEKQIVKQRKSSYSDIKWLTGC